jgi:hypothetical protein
MCFLFTMSESRIRRTRTYDRRSLLPLLQTPCAMRKAKLYCNRTSPEETNSLWRIANEASTRGATRPFATPYSPDPCWWSQTGSNRRPHACKARALPTELWPLEGSTPWRVGSKKSRKASGSNPDCLLPSAQGARTGDCPTWWAWEDLNLRPHAYQARALTN